MLTRVVFLLIIATAFFVAVVWPNDATYIELRTHNRNWSWAVPIIHGSTRPKYVVGRPELENVE